MFEHRLGGTMKYFFLLGIFLFSSAQASSLQNDMDSIRAQAGCYYVTFRYAETFPIQENYQLKPSYMTEGLEWVTVDEEKDGYIALQHVLITPYAAQKHWRQEWQYEAKRVIEFKGLNVWEARGLAPDEIQSSWLQRVFHVDDSPRYECSAAWVHSRQGSYWECKTWAPLPRRETTKRSDYDVMDRRNRHRITADGWIHEQDNTKVSLAGGKITPLVLERGENIYLKVDPSACDQAEKWWRDNKGSWVSIRAAWAQTYAGRDRFEFMTPADGVPLYEKLFDLGDKATHQRMTPKDVQAQAQSLIDSALKP